MLITVFLHYDCVFFHFWVWVCSLVVNFYKCMSSIFLITWQNFNCNFSLALNFCPSKTLWVGGCKFFVDLLLELKYLETNSCYYCWTTISKKAFPSFGPPILLHAQHVSLFQIFIVLYVALASFSSKGLRTSFMCYFYNMTSTSLVVNKFTSSCNSWIASYMICMMICNAIEAVATQFPLHNS